MKKFEVYDNDDESNDQWEIHFKFDRKKNS